ncbi:tol-pal system-associated acyl-CoA thioesterase [Paracoccaceae bacterium]|jgi:acyl-CoA thioester hydrolase|nr:tol-pal system-associated acyl-CoA thioesterase [Marinovum sp.]MDB3930376.1 tol-pal system-associated acyl-CoA thioesterase [Paracoccaceae bacterium]|tara:strand:- start:2374 stop:2766 length:393 start_codon:yes stop_codon:yes gene_type:complete
MNKSTFQCRVYYEDTDLAGIVYYANYLKFIERARSEWVRNLGLDQNVLRKDHGIVFAVRKVEADYLKSAKFDELLLISTELQKKTRVRLNFSQEIYRDSDLIFRANLVIVPLSVAGGLVKLPKIIFDKFM